MKLAWPWHWDARPHGWTGATYGPLPEAVVAPPDPPPVPAAPSAVKPPWLRRKRALIDPWGRGRS